MRAIFQQKLQRSSDLMMYIMYFVIGIVLVFIQLILLDFIAIGGMTPNLILILCIWIGLKLGRFKSMFVCFGLGIMFDMVSMVVIGTGALALTVVAFIAGYYHLPENPEKVIHSYKYYLIVTFCSVVYNLIYYSFYYKPVVNSMLSFIWDYGVLMTIYTLVFSVFVLLLKIPKKVLDR